MELVDSAAFASSPKAFFARIASSGQPALSYSEEFLWWGARLAGDTTFNVRVVLRLSGPLHVAALDASVVEIARRHETLRTVFPMEHGVILRRLLPPDSARPAVIDLESVDAADRQAEAWRLVLDESNRPFNLSRGPLFRAKLFRVNGNDHLLQFTIHHLVIDGRSVDILLRELSVLYEAFSQNKESPLPDLPVQYAEHAAHRRRQFQSGTMDKALSYWKRQLADIPSLLDLPTDRLRRTARHYRGQTITFELAADRTKALTQLARRHNTTLFVVLLATVKLLLHRLSGNPSIVIEAPLGNRRSLEAEGLIGLCVDLVMLRTDVTGDQCLSDLVSSVRRTTLGAFDHAGVPIHVLVGVLDATVDESHSALSQVMFNLIDRRQRAAHLESLNAEQMPLPDSPHSKFDLMLTAHLTDTLRFQLVYKRDLFSESRVGEFVEQFKTIVDQVLADPDKRVGQYSLVTPSAECVLPRIGRGVNAAAARSRYETLSDAARWTCEAFGIPPGARIGVLSAANPDLVIQAILTALWCRGSVCFPPVDGSAPQDLHGWLADGEIAVAYGEPATWRRLKKSAGALASLRYAFFIGGVLVREDVARVRAVAPEAACGYFWADHACYRVPSNIDALRTIVPIGRGLSGVELVVLNSDLQLAGIGELGELYVSRGGELVATGSTGRFLPDGNIDRIGNLSECATIDGYTIRFDEVASVLMEHPAVLDARVALDTSGNQAVLVAHVTIDDECACADDALDDFARRRLAGYMVPSRFK